MAIDPAASMQSDAFDPASNHLDARIDTVRTWTLRRRHELVVTRHDTGAVELRIDAGKPEQAGRLLARVHDDLHSKTVMEFFREWRVIS
ncbi:hypothetical protein ITJ38_14720 [Agreia pratensis]|uniref:Uncharacterized protein n=1 Tax=Agreia pratensis TaxID=150121 RepID=A0A1X7KRC5_9MICO|nr:hypothetical protein [Agreia pratensis]MBF4635664.1 hypothetical protein [Agreia pratensis]SMG43354.1 hypothetical protein SAMN06296010_2767 [Agreia pratensis]